jgi:hypothetical protein
MLPEVGGTPGRGLTDTLREPSEGSQTPPGGHSHPASGVVARLTAAS